MYRQIVKVKANDYAELITKITSGVYEFTPTERLLLEEIIRHYDYKNDKIKLTYEAIKDVFKKLDVKYNLFRKLVSSLTKKGVIIKYGHHFKLNNLLKTNIDISNIDKVELLIIIEKYEEKG